MNPEHPLLPMENALATPHTAGVTQGSSRRRAEAAAGNVLRVLRGEAPKYLVEDLLTTGGEGNSTSGEDAMREHEG